MALSVVQRPEGLYIKNTERAGTYTNGSSVITDVAHGLSTGFYVYIYDNEATGFYYVTTLSVDTFNIRDYSGATTRSFVGSGTFTYSRAVPTQAWNCVHLPITYKLKSTLWPINSVDTARTVSSYSDDNGYIKLTLSGSLNADVSELEFVRVVFTGGEENIYQIISWYSTSQVTINLPYIGGITFVSVQYYYNNYHAKIKLYAGLSTSHYYEAVKPYELITELNVVPDSDGVITLNINEFLKQKIAILNNDLLKGTLPNNLDAFCQFYITYAEAYDYTTGGYTLMDYVGAYVDDSGELEPYAANAELPFKNIHSGFLSEYIAGGTDRDLAKFLTPSLYPELTPGKFFDISFINPYTSGVRIRRECWKNGVQVAAFIDTIPDYDYGIYRHEVDQSIYLEDEIWLTVEQTAIAVSETKVITVNSECSPFTNFNLTWLNNLGGFDYWVFKSSADFSVDIEGTTISEKNIFANWPKSFGAGADRIRQETSRNSRQIVRLRAENLTANQINDLFRIRLSPLVQIIVSRGDRRNVIIDPSSFTYLQQREKLFSLEFNMSYTDNQPSQSL